MIKLSLKNYLKCLAHVFVPLGCIFLGVLFGADALFGVLSAQVAFVKEETLRLLTGMEADFDALWGFVLSSARELDWSKPFETLNLLLRGEWLAEKVGTFLGMTNEQSAQFLASIQNVLQTVGSELKGGIAVFFVWMVLGMIAGYFVTGLFVRRSTVRRGFWKMVAATLLESFFSATLISFTVWVLSVWSVGALLSAAVSMLVFGFVSLCKAYVLHGKTLRFRTVVNVKNCYLVQLAQLLIFVISLAIVGIILLCTNKLVALVIGLSVMIIALLVSNVNAESYVVTLADSLRTPPPDTGRAEQTDGQNAA